MQKFLSKYSSEHQGIAKSVFENKRLSFDQALFLYENADPIFCGLLADYKRTKLYQNKIFFNKNIHIEITNICVNKCKFCSFFREKGQDGSWDLEAEDVLEIVKEKVSTRITELHFTGGLHSKKTTDFYSNLFKKIKKTYPHLHIKAFTSVEIEHFSKVDGINLFELLKLLKESGLNSLAGGGAEILNDDIRKKICPEKTNSETWLQIHKYAHQLGLKTNCTMLYGHIETNKDRVKHLELLRNLQDETNGFNSFIPLKYKIQGNKLALKQEASLIDELKNYSISRLFLDNIPHLKAYWPMCGKETALLAMSFGADDFDGTISNTTKIYSMAGAEQKPELGCDEIKELAENAGFIAVERDSEYRELIFF
jgi:aminodeoxyfutalosine synthase